MNNLVFKVSWAKIFACTFRNRQCPQNTPVSDTRDKRYTNYKVARSFLDFSYEESNFSFATSLFTYTKV
jgi:hypothetical protein